MFQYKLVLRLNITSDLVGGGVQQDRGDGAYGEGAQDSTIHCDSPDRTFNLWLYCNALSNQGPKDIGLLQIKSPRLLQWDCLVDAHFGS